MDVLDWQPRTRCDNLTWQGHWQRLGAIGRVPGPRNARDALEEDEPEDDALWGGVCVLVPR